MRKLEIAQLLPISRRKYKEACKFEFSGGIPNLFLFYVKYKTLDLMSLGCTYGQ